MTYMIGAVLGAIGLTLLNLAHQRRLRVRTARAEAVRLGLPAERPIDANSIAALGEIVAPIVIAALAWFTLKVCVAYYLLPASDYYTAFDLMGTLVLVAGYASWLLAKTHYRMPELPIGLASDVAPAAEPRRPTLPVDGDGRRQLDPVFAAPPVFRSMSISASLE